MSKLFYILLALVVLLVLITVHEFGHYCAGKMFGFKINEFSIGFGPAIYKRKRKDGEIFAVRALPLGGYCAFEGEDEDGKDKPGSFNTMAGWKRIIVLLSGVTFNFLFAILTAAIYLMVAGFSTVQIKSVVYQNGSYINEFQKNDIIVAVDGKKVEAYRSFDSLMNEIKADYKKFGAEKGKFVVTVEREEINSLNVKVKKLVDVNVEIKNLQPFYFVSYDEFFEGKIFIEDSLGNRQPISLDKFTEEIMRISVSSETTGNGAELIAYLSKIYKTDNLEDKSTYAEDIETLLNGDNTDPKNPIYASITFAQASEGIGIIQSYVERDYGFFESILKAWPYCFYMAGLIMSSLIGLFTGSVAVSEAGGTITAISQIAEISEWGFRYFLLLLPMLSVNLALFNVLPIPSLDGARTLFVLIEIIFKKPVPRHIEGWIHTIGLFALLALVVFLDINHFFIGSIVLQL